MALLNINPSTELGAVNSIIGIIGEAPVNSLASTTSVDVVNARTLLAQESQKVQDKGWTFNIDESYVMTPDSFSQKIAWQPNWLRVISEGGTPYRNRGGYVYDRDTKSDLFTGDITAEVIELIPFDELPFCFQILITAKAARRFNAAFFGDPGVDSEAARLEADAQVSCNEYELDYGDYNLYNNTWLSGRFGR